MLSPKRVLAVGILCAIILSITLRGIHASDEASLTLERAEDSLAFSYQAVFEAEKAGANVTALLSGLNYAGLLLDKAHLEYRVGNFSWSVYFAEISYNVSSEITLRAMQLKDLTASEAAKRFWLTIITSSVSIGIIVLLSFSLWNRFKWWYKSRDRDLVL